MPLKEADKSTVIWTCVLVLCKKSNDYQLTADKEPSYAMCLLKACPSKGRIELGVVDVSVVPVCVGKATRGAYGGLFNTLDVQVRAGFKHLVYESLWLSAPPPPYAVTGATLFSRHTDV